jgi:predicted transport protein
MAKTSQQIEQEFIEGLKLSTGKDLKTWLSMVKKQGMEKRNDMINWLKKDLGFSHMNASLLIGIYLNDGKPVYANADNLLKDQFEKKEHLKPLYDQLIKEVQKEIKDTQVTAKKTYVSLHKKKEFAAINIKSNELGVGMDLGDTPFSDYLQKLKLTGPMPRISHMVIIQDKKDINPKLLGLIQKADKRING